jgi:hypothetical protein
MLDICKVTEHLPEPATVAMHSGCAPIAVLMARECLISANVTKIAKDF